MERSTAPEWQGEGPEPHAGRGATLPSSAELLAGAIASAVAALVLIETRFDGDWSDGVLLALAAAGSVALLALGLRGARPVAGPSVHRATLLIGGLVLLVVALVRVVEAATDGDSPEVAIAVAAAAFVAVSAGIGIAFRSAACTLLAAVGAGVLLAALVAAVADADSERPYLWAFAGYVAVALGGGVLLRAFGERRHSTQLVNAAAIAVILFTYALDFFFLGFESSEGDAYSSGLEREWEAAIVVGSLGALLFGLFFRERGPAWSGAVALAVSLFTVSGDADETPTLVGWPVALIAVAMALTAAAAFRARADRG